MASQDVDFRALYENSLKLTTAIDDFGIPPLEKGLEQLQDASRTFQQQPQQQQPPSQQPSSGRHDARRQRGRAGAYTAATMDSSSVASRYAGNGSRTPAMDRANFLLAAKGIDAEKLTRELQSFEISAGFEPQMPLGETDVEGFLKHHHEMILLTAIDDVNRRTRETTHDRMNQAMIDDFDRLKERFLEHLGGSTQAGIRQYPRVQGDVEERNLFASMDAASSSTGRPLNMSQSSSAVMMGNSIASSSIDGPLRMSQLSVENLLTDEMKTHYLVVKELLAARVPQSRCQFDVVGAFERACESNAPSNVVGSKWELAFKSFRLLQFMLVGGLKNSTQARSIGENEFMDFQVDDQQRRSLEYRFAFGARVFLEDQFRVFIQQTVQKQQLATGGIPDLLSNVRAFVRYLQSSRYAVNGPDASFSTEGEGNVWALVYYCLRCGGDQEAVDLVSSSMRAGDVSLDADVLCALRFRNHMRRNSQEVNGSDAVNSFSRQFADEYDRLMERYQRLTGSSMDSVAIVNPYERVVLNLLCFGNPNASEPRILSTIEDYLWQRLCFIQLPGQAKNGPDSAYTIARLSRSIQKFGPSHFESSSASKGSHGAVFMYFEILLLTQEFEKAINYIASKGYLLEAAHFAITLQFYGLLRTNSTAMGDNETVDLIRLIRQYVHSFQRANPVEAAEYIAFIPDMTAKKELLSDLVLDTRKFDSLVGFTSSTDGCRTRGIYDRILQDETEADVKELILHAARKAESRGRPYDALALLKSAGDVEGILALLNTQLGSIISGSKLEREEWFRVAKDFAERWMRYPWVQSIASQRARTAAIAFQTLLNLCIFLDLFEKQEYEDAIRFVGELDIVPTVSNDNIALCVDRFLAFEESVRQNFHLLLLGYMECLVRNAERLKAHFSNSDSRRANVNTLREKAELLVTFAGMIKFRLPSGTIERLHRMEGMIY